MRPRLNYAVIVASFLLFPSLAYAQDSKEAAAKLKAIAKKDSQVQAHLRYLCKNIGPRLTGSDNLQKAYEWTRDQFKSYGLEARLEQWGTAPIGFNRGKSSGKIIRGGAEKALGFGTHAWTAGTNGAVRGPAILEPRSQNDLDKLGPLKNAWIVARSSRTPRRNSPLRAKLWEMGIAGIVTPVSGELIVTSGRSRGISMTKLPTQVQVRLLNSQWKELTGYLAKGEKIELEFDIQNQFKKGPVPHYNVIADIKGSERPDEIVIVGGHLDTWDESEGATDNGTGVATALEAARLIMKAGIKPKRTIRFILWSGEEQGLLGSAAYVRAHRSEMAKVSAVLVHDGGTNTCSGLTATEAMFDQLSRAFAGVIDDGSKFPFQLRKVSGLRGGGSDHSSYLRAGVPGFFWIQRGRHNYTYTHHTQHDNFDQAVPEYQRRSAIVIATGAVGIADLENLLNRTQLQAPQRSRKVLGVQLADGLIVDTVTPGSVAAKAGFLPGDKFLSGAGRKIASLNDLRRVIQEATGNTAFVVERSGQKKTLAAKFPKARARPNQRPERRKVLGITLAGDGLEIGSVTPGSVADKAGMKVGDVLVRGSGKALSSLEELRTVIQRAKGKTSFIVLRGKREVALNADFGGEKAKKKAKLY